MSVTINTAAFEKRARGEIMEKLRDCAVIAVATCKENMPRTGEPSEPGEFPHVDTETLKQHVTFELDGRNLTARWGILARTAAGRSLIYALYLVTGTKDMAPRDFLTLTKDLCWDDWKKILGVR